MHAKNAEFVLFVDQQLVTSIQSQIYVGRGGFGSFFVLQNICNNQLFRPVLDNH